MNRLNRALLCILLSVSLLAFNQLLAADLKIPYLNKTALSAQASFITCQEPRPEICYESFAPVCAIFRSHSPTHQADGLAGVAHQTVMNDCKACANTQVQGFIRGACP